MALIPLILFVCLLQFTVFNPTKPHIRTKILIRRGFTPRTDKVPLQVPENIQEVQNELKGNPKSIRFLLQHLSL